MAATASDTTKALKQSVFPFLKRNGFDDWTTRKAWRHKDGIVAHVEFRSFNTYYADSFACTPASVSVCIGMQTPQLPGWFTKAGPKGPRPDECQLPIRGQLSPSLDCRLRNELGIWRIEEPSDALVAANDIMVQFERYGLNWLDRKWGSKPILNLLAACEDWNPRIEVLPNKSSLWIEAGAPDSPGRNKMLADLAMHDGDFDAAATLFERARWALDHRTGLKYLFLSASEDAAMVARIEECRCRAQTDKPA